MNHKQNKKSIVGPKGKKGIIGMAPFDGYNDIKKEELTMLKNMTMEDARIQTEALLRAVKWMR